MRLPPIRTWTVTQKLTLSFASVILIGTTLLSSPLTHSPSAHQATFLDHLFNVVSMVCVTGLSVIPVSEAYNGLGQTIVICLMQIGGLGLVSFIAFSTFALKRKMDLSGHTLLQSALNRKDSKNLKDFLFFAYKITFIIEMLACAIIAIEFVPRFGWKNGLFNSVFLAVSAFCNAGFDNLGSSSLKDFVLNPTINFVISALIIFGGIGFAVWHDVTENLRRYFVEKPKCHGLFYRKLSNQTRLVLQTTGLILVLGTLLTWFLEKDNPKTIANYTFIEQLMVSFFQTVTMRTAGFATLSYLDTLAPTNFLYMIQMVIGGAPGGTAGGIKVTTVAITILLLKAELSGQSQVTFQNRIITSRTVKQTMSVLIFFMSVFIIGYTLLLSVEPTLDPVALLFEAVSAIDTVGVTMDITPKLSTPGRVIIMFLMFIGRVGPITFLLSLIQRKEKTIRYATTDILVG
ncbi:cation transport protein [Streptococcus porcinus]|uniref:TrkH family potassium uptake protein n=1 Tax=Streptococcus porcinus TaxID=1340 RepID=A0A4U9ZI24_STRPO|nr:potassium uptake transporter channel subunit KtrB [Streptococcus porcinus]MBA2796411.1 TrkH family potassium uptake protein [Streptococcus porcinus]VTS38781.1 cation transport protein [Streptococcus porcinus]